MKFDALSLRGAYLSSFPLAAAPAAPVREVLVCDCVT